jgi:predicted Zn-dependent peptidase
MNDYKRIKLPNGVRVVLVPQPAAASVTFQANYEVGSRYEPDSLIGASHFIEHMCFKGTKRRPSTKLISQELDAVGAEYNAYTDYDHTSYHVRLQPDKLALGVDIIEDMVHGALYRAKDCQSEVGVISEELNMYEDNPMMTVNEQMQEELFPNATIGRRIGGTPATVAAIKRAEMIKYFKQYYRPSRMVVVVAGNFDPAEAERLIVAKYGEMWEPKTKAKPYKRWRSPKTGRGPVCRVVTKPTEQAQLSIGWEGLPFGHAQSAALAVLGNILGGTMSSRLMISIRDQHGLAYFIHTNMQAFQDTGVFLIQSGLAKDNVAAALELVAKELKAIKAKPVTSKELKRSQENIKGRLLLGLEETMNLAGWYARRELLAKKIVTPEQRIQQIMEVTAADVQRVAKQVLQSKRAAMAVIGPFEDGREFVKRIRNF